MNKLVIDFHVRNLINIKQQKKGILFGTYIPFNIYHYTEFYVLKIKVLITNFNIILSSSILQGAEKEHYRNIPNKEMIVQTLHKDFVAQRDVYNAKSNILVTAWKRI